MRLDQIIAVGLRKTQKYFWIWGLMGLLTGAFGTGFVKFTIYYLAEESSVRTLRELGEHSKIIDDHLQSIDVLLTKLQDQTREDSWSLSSILDQHKKIIDKQEGGTISISALHESLIELRADLRTQNERILFLLDPKTKGIR